MKYTEFAELIAEDQLAHFRSFEDEDEARTEYHRLLESAEDKHQARQVTEAFEAYRSAPSSYDADDIEEPEPMDRKTRSKFMKELDEAPTREAGIEVLRRYNKLDQDPDETSVQYSTY